ncbi:hypothetical protein NQ315_006597 [Exocentrus adspersus]|uniref:Uncharacterized protein n=1 Tax=Exocentrus adspersus TaxID=1586481 RepID=A0AAV8VG56_9CUCU|nr:hypothetical protein NQ315_006597 [Exocentrus adspersus]
MPKKGGATRHEKSDSNPNLAMAVSMTNEQFLQLLNEVRVSAKESSVELLETVRANVQITPPNVTNFAGTFSKCTARFNGSDKSDVDAFIDSIETYKECSKVSDENALRGLSMLLEGVAATWWQGVKKTITDWKGAIAQLKDAYSTKLPPHLVYREIFTREQFKTETTDLFTCRVRALIAQLPYELPEAAQLDIVYGLLHKKIRKRLPRGNFENFHDLLTSARDIERSIQETPLFNEKENKGASKKSGEKTENCEKKLRPKCNFCKFFGHTTEDCRKLAKKEKTPEAGSSGQTVKQESTDSPKLQCYGCGQVGVVRSKCQNCTKKREDSEPVQVKALQFNQVSTKHDSSSSARPLLPITIANAEGVGFADSGAQVSIAGYKLYQVLEKAGHEFTSTTVQMSYADGNIRQEDVLQANVEVTIKNRKVNVKFTILPKLTNNHTLLGVDFLQKANVVLNIPESTWYFCDKPDERYQFYDEFGVLEDVQVFEVSEQSFLRTDEAETLSSQQRCTFNGILKENQDIFEPGEDLPILQHITYRQLIIPLFLQDPTH